MTYELPVNVTVCQSILHGSNMETALVSFAEMGVTEVIPMRTARMLKMHQSAREDAQKQYARWISRFVKNSLREVTPTLHQPMDFADVVKRMGAYDLTILAYENARDPLCTAKAIAACKDAKRVLVLIGPERGFEPDEVEMAKAAGAHIVSLGKRIIRAANAGAIFMGMLVYALELNAESEGGQNIV